MRGGSVMRHMGWAGLGVGRCWRRSAGREVREGREGGIWSMKTRDGFFPAGDKMVVEGVGGGGEEARRGGNT